MRPTPTGEHVVVETPAGAVRGLWRAGSAAFLGIPFAEPPFGDLRFQAPVRRAPWSGVRDALQYGSTPQRKALMEITTIPEPSVPGEDVLCVNVFTPRPRPSEAGETPLPVLVYVHGGGYVAGSPASPWYDGAAFNRDGVVTVSVSYRLGFEGFGLLPDAPANRGVLDWLLALEWVRDSIGSFGGDPQRVTIAGQSAGGGAAMTLLTMPRARGLFTGVVSMSGAPADVSLEDARATTQRIAAALGVAPDRAGFAGVTEEALLAAQGWGLPSMGKLSAEGLITVMRSMDGRLPLGPVVDGDLLTGTVEEGLQAGAGADVPLLMGSTRQEFGGIAHAFRHLFEEHDVAGVLDALGVAPEVARRFAGVLPGHHPADVMGRYVSDVMFRRRVVDWLELRRGAAPTWVYDFAWRSAVSGVAEHCLDVPFAFDLLDDPDVTRVAGPGAPQQLADRVHGAYVAFVRDQDPGWPAHDDGQAVMVFDADGGIVPSAYDSARTLTAPELATAPPA
ncbi:carboxylesterase/lipase family protein [Modestobacter sp. KNN46-3]|jgi:para-nitrobenzyl esterase|uniref:carboxylesterase/lipase family protein n=1 Tax=Modestobacter sp. KNN46-3 TaxID=2711218 RepID=UPI0013DF20DD|nr:carboxylesterase family protein [Modestobacter sp. KNN46-3]